MDPGAYLNLDSKNSNCRLNWVFDTQSVIWSNFFISKVLFLASTWIEYCFFLWKSTILRPRVEHVQYCTLQIANILYVSDNDILSFAENIQENHIKGKATKRPLSYMLTRDDLSNIEMTYLHRNCKLHYLKIQVISGLITSP